jgi:hypothetical protein
MNMKRRVFITGFAATLMRAGMALASGVQEDVVAQLRGQGFSQIKVATTWLGRTRITAQKGNLSREIVLNPRTGEILRDLLQNGDNVVLPRIGESGGGERSGSPGGGGSGSGSGSGGSGSGGDDGESDATDDHGGTDGGGSHSGGSSGGTGSGGTGSGSSGSGGSKGSDGGDDRDGDEHEAGDD